MADFRVSPLMAFKGIHNDNNEKHRDNWDKQQPQQSTRKRRKKNWDRIREREREREKMAFLHFYKRVRLTVRPSDITQYTRVEFLRNEISGTGLNLNKIASGT